MDGPYLFSTLSRLSLLHCFILQLVTHSVMVINYIVTKASMDRLTEAKLLYLQDHQQATQVKCPAQGHNNKVTELTGMNLCHLNH